MHKIFVTEGVVLGKRGVGEANNLVSILTQELGLVRASARSARVEKSKLRYGLESLTVARFSLVRGKHEWRLTGVEAVSRKFAESALARQRLGKITKLLIRLIHGEERVPELYQTIKEGFDSLAQAKSSEAEALECVLVLRTLFHLGYLPHTEALAPYVEGGFSVELSARALRERALLVRAINESLSMTGL